MSMCSIVEEVVSKLNENERLVLVGEKFEVGVYKDFGVSVEYNDSLLVTDRVDLNSSFLTVRERKYSKADLESECVDKTHIILFDKILHMEIINNDSIVEADKDYKKRLHDKMVNEVNERAISIVSSLGNTLIPKCIKDCNYGEYTVEWIEVASNIDTKYFYNLDLENDKDYSDIRVIVVELAHFEDDTKDIYVDLLVNTITNDYEVISNMDKSSVEELAKSWIE